MNIPPVAFPTLAPSAKTAAPSGSEAFRQMFADAVMKVAGTQNVARAAIDRFLAGEGEEIHQVALKSQQAELAFELFMQVRNKVIAAYQEVMRMQV